MIWMVWLFWGLWHTREGHHVEGHLKAFQHRGERELVSLRMSCEYSRTARGKHQVFPRETLLGSRICRLQPNRLWDRLTLTLLRLGVVFQPEGVWGGWGRGRAVFVPLCHCPVRGWRSPLSLVISLTRDGTVGVCAYADSTVVLSVSMPFSGDGHWPPGRVRPSGQWRLGRLLFFV